MEYDQEIDATGLLCPLPVLKAAKRLRAMAVGEVLKIRADDPAAVVDVPHFCAEQNHELLEQSQNDSELVFVVRKGKKI
jgi:tRNA 2-thiouridine synthesizing protein A